MTSPVERAWLTGQLRTRDDVRRAHYLASFAKVHTPPKEGTTRPLYRAFASGQVDARAFHHANFLATQRHELAKDTKSFQARVRWHFADGAQRMWWRTAAIAGGVMVGAMYWIGAKR